MAASAHDNQVGIALLNKVAAGAGSVKTALVDQGFRNSVVEHGPKAGIDVQIVERNPQPGFTPQPIRWRVEQTYGTLILQRRLTRDYEGDPRTTESRINWASSTIMMRKLTGGSVPSWRGA